MDGLYCFKYLHLAMTHFSYDLNNSGLINSIKI